jgi:hypothetical protein
MLAVEGGGVARHPERRMGINHRRSLNVLL